MNIVFWLPVVVVLAMIWCCLSFAFKGIGGIGLKLYNDTKDKIIGKNGTEEESKEDHENER